MRVSARIVRQEIFAIVGECNNVVAAGCQREFRGGFPNAEAIFTAFLKNRAL